MFLLILFAVVSIAFSFICSILEAVLLSVTPTFISTKKQEKKTYAADLERMKSDVDTPLIAILTLNTIAHTVGAILVGVQAKTAYAELFGSKVHTILGVPITEDLMVGIVSTVMTILILVASEIIPKTLGATHWRKLANFTVQTLKVLIFVLKWTGLLWVLRLATKAIGGSGHESSVLSRQDYMVMTDVIGESGELEKEDYDLIRNVLRFDDLHAKHVMTPRTVMVMASENQTLSDFYEANRPFVFSRMPLYKESKDNVSGVLLKDDLLQALVDGKGGQKLADIKREANFVPQNMPLRNVFERLNEKRSHMALAVDEYGTVLGLVTLEDIFETLFGLEIMDETDSVSDLQQYARQKWQERAKKMGLIE